MAYEVGMRASFTKTIAESDVYLYAGLTGDMNPAHVDAVWAAGTRFGERIAHGMLSSGLISTVLGTKLPGPGTIYLGQELKFTAPVRFGDTVTAEAVVIEVVDGRRLRLKTTVTNQEGTVVIEGEATVLAPKQAS